MTAVSVSPWGRRQIAVLFAVGAAALGVGVLAGYAPSQAVGLVAAAAFVPIVFLRFQVGVGIFIVSTFLGLSGTAQKGIGLLVIVAALQQAVEHRDEGGGFMTRYRGLTLALIGYLAWVFAGLLWAGTPGDVISSLTRYGPNLLVFFVIFTAARGRRDLFILAGFFVFGSAVAAASAVLSPPPSSAYGSVARAGGIFGDPNDLAAVLVAGLTISAAMALVRSITVVAQAAAATACALCLLGILFSVSRGGLIALAVALFTGVVVAGRWRWRLAGVVAVVAVIGIGYFTVLAPGGAAQRLTSSADGGSGRTTIWAVGWREVVHNPVIGVGAGNFSDAGKRYVLEPGAINHLAGGFTSYFIDTPTVAHNTYLEVLAEGGVVGLGLFLAILVASLRSMLRAALVVRDGDDREMEMLCYGVCCGVVGFLAASFFLSEEYSKQLYVLIALGPALLRVARLAARTTTEPRSRPPNRAAVVEVRYGAA